MNIFGHSLLTLYIKYDIINISRITAILTANAYVTYPVERQRATYAPVCELYLRHSFQDITENIVGIPYKKNRSAA